MVELDSIPTRYLCRIINYKYNFLSFHCWLYTHVSRTKMQCVHEDKVSINNSK